MLLHKQIINALIDEGLIQPSELNFYHGYTGYEVVSHPELHIAASATGVEFAVLDNGTVRRLGDMGHAIKAYSANAQALYAVEGASIGIDPVFFESLRRPCPSLEMSVKLFKDGIEAYTNA